MISKPTIQEMLDDLTVEIEIETLTHSQDFVNDLKDYYKRFKRLYEAQETALRKLYRRHMA